MLNRRTLALVLALFATAALADPIPSPPATANSGNLPTVAVGSLETCSGGIAGREKWVTGLASTSSCSGTGSAATACLCNGTTWTARGAGGGASSNSFETITSSSGSAVADSATDTLTLTNGTGVTISCNSGADSCTWTATLGVAIEPGEMANADFGSFTCASGVCTIDSTAVSSAMLGSSIDPTKLSPGTVSSTELGYLDGVTSAIQTQLTARPALATGTATPVGSAACARVGDYFARTDTTPDELWQCTAIGTPGTWEQIAKSSSLISGTSVVLRDGSQALTGSLPFGGFKGTGLAAGTTAGDSVRYEQLENASGVFKGFPRALTAPLDFEYPPVWLDFGMKRDYTAYAFSGGALIPFFGASTPQVPSLAMTSTTTSGSQTVTVSSTTGLVEGMAVTGTGVPANTFILSITPTTTLTLNQAATASGSVTLSYIGKGVDRNTTTTSGSAVVTPASSDTSNIVAGMGVSGTGIQAGTTVQSVSAGVSVTLSSNAQVTGTQSLSYTAPSGLATKAWPTGAAAKGGVPVSGQYLFESGIGQPTANLCGIGESALKCSLGTKQSAGTDWRTSGDIQTTMDGSGAAGDNATVLAVEPYILGSDEVSYVFAYGYGDATSAVLTTAGAISGSNFSGFRGVCTFNGVDASFADVYFVTQRATTTGAATLIATGVPCGYEAGAPVLVLKLAFSMYGNFTSGSGGAIIECSGHHAAYCVTPSKTLVGVASSSVSGTSFLMPQRLQSTSYTAGSNRYYFHMAGVVLTGATPSVETYVGTSYLWIANTMPRL